MSGRFDAAFLAPAKINRFLHITGRRADGYHELQTVFQFVGLADTLRFEPLECGRIEMAAGAVDGDNNLCLRAARALADASGAPLGVRIHLDKCIPIGGGLGGGSSDAATTLVALNHLFDLGLSEDELAAIGLGLGADVPMFGAAVSTPELTRLLESAVAEHAPPLVSGRRIKLRYAHQGGQNPPVIVIHGNQTDALPGSYKRYLENFFRKHLGLVGTPLRMEFRSGRNPYAGRRNILTLRQQRKRKRMMRHVRR